MASICNICCEAHNKTTRQNVRCDYGDCGFEACKSCVRQYLLSTTSEPHCMNCKKAWGQEFLVRKLNRSFITSDYKVHRTKLLCEREISKLPETMAVAENYRQAERETELAAKLRLKLESLQKELRQVRHEMNGHYVRAHSLQNGGNKEEKRQFIMPCQSEGCRGFLSTSYKCGLCHVYTCPKCLDVVGYQKDEAHECKEENVQSAEMIRKDTKPCPSCGTRIFKIDGCDQMWCSNCHTAWSWRSGKVDHGVVHNPHFYEFQRNGGNTIPRAPGDEVCGGLCHYSAFRSHIARRLKNKALSQELSNLHRLLAHVLHIELQGLRRTLNHENDHTTTRVSYILGRIDKEQLSKHIYRTDVNRRKNLELVQVYEILNEVGSELFARLRDNQETGSMYEVFVEQQLNNYHELRKYCNTQFAKISTTYSRQAPQINPDWKMDRFKK